jgi:hypothetical protein
MLVKSPSKCICTHPPKGNVLGGVLALGDHTFMPRQAAPTPFLVAQIRVGPRARVVDMKHSTLCYPASPSAYPMALGVCVTRRDGVMSKLQKDLGTESRGGRTVTSLRQSYSPLEKLPQAQCLTNNVCNHSTELSHLLGTRWPRKP